MEQPPTTNTDEFGFIEVKIKNGDDEIRHDRHHGLEDLSIEELQKLCQEEIEKKKRNKNNDRDDHSDPWKKDSPSVEKEIAIELLLGHGNKCKNSGSKLDETADYFLRQKVAQMSAELGQGFVSDSNTLDALHAPFHQKDEERKRPEEQESSELPAWLLNLEPEVQREFLEAMKMNSSSSCGKK